MTADSLDESKEEQNMRPIHTLLVVITAIATTAVVTAQAVGRDDPWIVVRDGHDLPTVFAGSDELKAAIQDLVRRRRSTFEYPREIEFLDEIPMTTTGKIRRVELRKRDLESKRS